MKEIRILDKPEGTPIGKPFICGIDFFTKGTRYNNADITSGVLQNISYSHNFPDEANAILIGSLVNLKLFSYDEKMNYGRAGCDVPVQAYRV